MPRSQQILRFHKPSEGSYCCNHRGHCQQEVYKLVVILVVWSFSDLLCTPTALVQLTYVGVHILVEPSRKDPWNAVLRVWIVPWSYSNCTIRLTHVVAVRYWHSKHNFKNKIFESERSMWSTCVTALVVASCAWTRFQATKISKFWVPYLKFEKEHVVGEKIFISIVGRAKHGE